MTCPDAPSLYSLPMRTRSSPTWTSIRSRVEATQGRSAERATQVQHTRGGRLLLPAFRSFLHLPWLRIARPRRHKSSRACTSSVISSPASYLLQASYTTPPARFRLRLVNSHTLHTSALDIFTFAFAGDPDSFLSVIFHHCPLSPWTGASRAALKRSCSSRLLPTLQRLPLLVL